MSRLCASASISFGSIRVVKTSGASILPPRRSGRYDKEKFKSPSKRRTTQSSSPSQFRRFEARQNGCSKLAEAGVKPMTRPNTCLLYTSDAADEEDSVDLGGRRIIKKKKKPRRT